MSVWLIRRLRFRIPLVAVLVAWSEYSPLTSMVHLSILIWSESLTIPSPPTSLLMYSAALGADCRNLRWLLYNPFSGVSRVRSSSSDHGENLPGKDIFLWTESFTAIVIVSGLASLCLALSAASWIWSLSIWNCLADEFLISICTPKYRNDWSSNSVLAYFTGIGNGVQSLL